MLRNEDKIVIFKNEDRELYRLVEKIEVTKFGVLRFNNEIVKEIKVKSKKPYQVITIEKSTLLSEDYE